MGLDEYIMSDPRLPTNAPQGYIRDLVVRLNELFRAITNTIDSLRGGHISAATNTMVSAPTTGMWNKGDQVRNSNPSELGAGGSKYVIVGWLCVTAGEPGTWVEMRCLTGN